MSNVPQESGFYSPLSNRFGYRIRKSLELEKISKNI